MDGNHPHFYPVRRHGGNDENAKHSFIHASSQHPYSIGRRRQLSTRGWITFGTFVSIILILFIRHSTLIKTTDLNQPLSDQPAYTIPPTCRVRLCNPTNRCSFWYPSSNPRHQQTLLEWSDLVQQGIYRDLATIEVDRSCTAFLQVEDETPGLPTKSQWIPITSGLVVDCLEQKCRNAVAVKIQHDIGTLLTQLETMVSQDPNLSEQEIVLVRPVNSTLDQWVTLVTQFSVNRLNIFTNVIDAWAGPISVTIYLTEWKDIESIKTFFSNSINAELYQRITLTIVKPAYNSNTNEHLRYPINHLRNLAVVASSTPYVFVMDADFVPSTSLYTTAQSVLPNMNTTIRTAMVVPCFAMYEQYGTLPLPTTMVDVKKMVEDGIAYVTDPGAGHGPTLGKEMALAMATTRTDTRKQDLASISYEVCYESQWEPYYIVSKDRAPLYDARFKNQGGDKQSHALQLNAEGFRFMVLANEFMIHKDHAKLVWPGGGFAKAQKDQQAWSYFGGFMREMEKHYGHNVRWPHGCSAMAIGWQEQRRNTLGMAVGVV